MNPALSDKLNTLSQSAFTASKDREWYFNQIDKIPTLAGVSNGNVDFALEQIGFCENQIVSNAETIEVLLMRESMLRGN